ncbi:MAG: autotransporter outer membrane beta-barrel domain-containing protein [Chlorobiota bacterium]
MALALAATLCLLVLLESATAVAQEDVLRPRGAPVVAPWEEPTPPVLLGIEVGGNWNMASQTLQYSPFEPTNTPSRLFRSGSGFSPTFNVGADVGLTPQLGLVVRAGYDIKQWGNSGTGEADCADFLTGVVREVPVSAEWTLAAHYITLGAGLRYNLTPQLWLSGGVTVHFHRTNQQKEKYSVEDPVGGCGFRNPGDPFDPNPYRTLEVTGKWNVPPMKGSRIGLELGAGYRIMLGHKLWLVPRVQFQLLSSFREDVSSRDFWKPSEGIVDVIGRNASQHSLQLLVGLWFGL